MKGHDCARRQDNRLRAGGGPGAGRSVAPGREGGRTGTLVAADLPSLPALRNVQEVRGRKDVKGSGRQGPRGKGKAACELSALEMLESAEAGVVLAAARRATPVDDERVARAAAAVDPGVDRKGASRREGGGALLAPEGDVAVIGPRRLVGAWGLKWPQQRRRRGKAGAAGDAEPLDCTRGRPADQLRQAGELRRRASQSRRC